MSTWTWTFIKPEYLSKDQIKSLLEDAIKHTGGVYYDNYRKHGWDYELKDWLNFHKEEYDYFVNECGVSPEKMTEEYLTKDLKKRIETCDKNVNYYQMVLDGKMTFREMLENTKEGDPKHNAGYSHDFYVIKRQGDIYVNLRGEWWRNQRDSEDEFNTVDSLIEEVKKSHYLGYYDEDIKDWVKESELTPKLEKKLREFYANIGDNNFYVHFG
jgi:hypothetical protein